jgi:hypothetical protein
VVPGNNPIPKAEHVCGRKNHFEPTEIGCRNLDVDSVDAIGRAVSALPQLAERAAQARRQPRRGDATIPRQFSRPASGARVSRGIADRRAIDLTRCPAGSPQSAT